MYISSYTSSLLCSHSGISRRILSSQPKSILTNEFEIGLRRSGIQGMERTQPCKMRLPHVGHRGHLHTFRGRSPTGLQSSPSHMMSVEASVEVNQELGPTRESVLPLGPGQVRSIAFRSPAPGAGFLWKTRGGRRCECS